MRQFQALLESQKTVTKCRPQQTVQTRGFGRKTPGKPGKTPVKPGKTGRNRRNRGKRRRKKPGKKRKTLEALRESGIEREKMDQFGVVEFHFDGGISFKALLAFLVGGGFV